MIKIKITLKDDIVSLEGKVLNAFRLHLDSVFKRSIPGVRRRISNVCESLIKRSEEYQSLLNGQLLGELGVPDVDRRLNAILATIKRGVEVESTPIIRQGASLHGGLVFKMIKSDFLDILSLPEAVYETDKGTPIPWLDWLIAQGDRIIVIGYDVKFNLSPREKSYSRTGLALMEKGTGWRVPPEYSGTLDNNFITRAFNPGEVESLLTKILVDEIKLRV